MGKGTLSCRYESRESCCFWVSKSQKLLPLTDILAVQILANGSYTIGCTKRHTDHT